MGTVAPSEEPGPAWRGRALILACSLLPWAAALPGPFLYDDYLYVVYHRFVSHPDVPSVLASPFVPGNPSQGLYRPLTILSYAADLRAWNLNPVGFHMTNLLLHAATAFLVAGLARALRLQRSAATLAGALFGAHAQHAEVVGWITGRSEILSTGFAILAILLWMRAGTARSLAWEAGAFLAFVLAVLSKETGVTAPALAFLVAAARGRIAWRRWFARAGACVLFLASWGALRILLFAPDDGNATAGSFLERLGPARDTSPTAEYTLLQRLGLLVPSQGYHLLRLLWPVRLSVVTQYPSPAEDPVAYWAGALLLGLAMALPPLLWLRGQYALCACAAWYWVAQAPTLNILPIGERFAERFLYLASAGVCVLGGAALSRGRTFRIVAILGLSLLASRHASVWGCWPRSREAPAGTPGNDTPPPQHRFWSEQVREKPGDTRPYAGLGVLWRFADGERAEHFLRKSLTINRNGYSLFFFAYIRDRRGEDPAVTCPILEASVRLIPQRMEAVAFLADLYDRLGRYEEALRLYAKVALTDPHFEDIHYHVARLILRQDADRALAYLTEVAHPRTEIPAPRAHCLRAALLWERGDRQAARGIVREALRSVDVKYPARTVEFRILAAADLVKRESLPLAEICLREAAALDPQKSQIPFNLGVVIAAQGEARREEAAVHLRRAVDLGYKVPPEVWDAAGLPRPGR
ncbi:MAG: hypothetical protein HY608_06425 [Planctomycetes bacterium]|nr:hypothetical protein [Planctomycetota bacterium]